MISMKMKVIYAVLFCYASCLLILLWCVQNVRIRYFGSDADSYDDDSEIIVKWKRRILEESCHMSRKDDALELLRSNASLPPNSIFFHETSCNSGLTSRQACIVESAAKANAERQINVLFTSAVSEHTLTNSCLSILLDKYENVKLARVLIVDYAEETPVASRVRNMDSESLNRHISKIMKFLTMYKYSGIYLSLDVIVARKFDLWENWAVRDTPATFSTDMFAFSKNNAGRKLAASALGFLLADLTREKRDFWSYSGSSSVISRLLESWCSVGKVELMTLSKCNGIAVYGPELFYPISFHDRRVYFNIADWDAWKKKDIFTYFIWNHFTKYNLISSVSLYGKIANEYCPVIYKHHSDKFGLWYPWVDDVEIGN